MPNITEILGGFFKNPRHNRTQVTIPLDKNEISALTNQYAIHHLIDGSSRSMLVKDDAKLKELAKHEQCYQNSLDERFDRDHSAYHKMGMAFHEHEISANQLTEKIVKNGALIRVPTSTGNVQPVYVSTTRGTSSAFSQCSIFDARLKGLEQHGQCSDIFDYLARSAEGRPLTVAYPR